MAVVAGGGGGGRGVKVMWIDVSPVSVLPGR